NTGENPAGLAIVVVERVIRVGVGVSKLIRQVSFQSAAHRYLKGIVVSVGLVLRHLDTVVTEVRYQRIVGSTVCLESCQTALQWEICLSVVTLMAVLASNIGRGQHRLSDGLLDAQAELCASRRGIVILVQASDVIDRDRCRNR